MDTDSQGCLPLCPCKLLNNLYNYNLFYHVQSFRNDTERI